MLRINNKDVEIMRLGLGLTQADLGRLSYTTRQNIWNIENGKINSKTSLYLLQFILDSMYEGMSEDEKKVRLAMGQSGIRVKTKQQIIDFKNVLEKYKESD